MVMVLVRMTRLMPAMHPVEVSVQVPVVSVPTPSPEELAMLEPVSIDSPDDNVMQHHDGHPLRHDRRPRSAPWDTVAAGVVDALGQEDFNNLMGMKLVEAKLFDQKWQPP